MKRLLMVGMLVVAGSVQAADWVFVLQADNNEKYYIDKASIKYNSQKSTVNVWRKVNNYSEPFLGKTETSRIELIEYNCSDRAYKIISGSYYSNNNLIKSLDWVDLKKRYIVPDSAGDFLLNVVCINPPKLTLFFKGSFEMEADRHLENKVNWILIKMQKDGSRHYIAQDSFVYSIKKHEVDLWEKVVGGEFKGYSKKNLTRYTKATYHCEYKKYKLYYSILKDKDKILSVYNKPDDPIVAKLNPNGFYFKAACTNPSKGIYQSK